MAQECPKFHGVVLRFNKQKGFGFIKPDNEADEVFVHYSDINSDGFRTLRKNQSVEFSIADDPQANKPKAVYVTVIKDSTMKNVRNGGGSRGGVRGKAIECHNCGKYGHFARDCYATNACYNCGFDGHFAKDCMNESYCFNCDGEFGHITRDCKRTRAHGGGEACYNCGKEGSSSGGGSGKRGGGKCFNCNKEGHFAKDCPNSKK